MASAIEALNLGELPMLANTVISNPAGVDAKVYFNGAAVESAIPVSVVAHHQVLNITITNYAADLHVTFIAQREAIPDVQRLADFTVTALQDLNRTFVRRKQMQPGTPKNYRQRPNALYRSIPAPPCISLREGLWGTVWMCGLWSRRGGRVAPGLACRLTSVQRSVGTTRRRTTAGLVEGWLARLPVGLVADYRWVEIPATRPPGEWRDPQGALATPVCDYAKVSGSMTICLVAWHPGVDVMAALALRATARTPPDAVRAESRRLTESTPGVAGWDYLWYLGPGEIYRPARTPQGEAAIRCETHGDVGILRREARLPLEPGTQLSWSWCVEGLPSDLREDSLPAHDYVSIAVEFDDGQDLTYYWSSTLPVGKVYRCPLPTWRSKETHVVVRSGVSELGRWLDERRDLHADYQRIIGGPARSIVRIWLIANSLFQRGQGRCEYARIALTGPAGASVAVL